MNNIVLASASIGRKKLFHQYFDNFQVSVSNIDESRIKENDPYELTKKLALIKAKMVAKYYKDDFVLGFDTIVLCEGQLLGKPKTKDDAIEMLKDITGKRQSVVSGYAIINLSQGIQINDWDVTHLTLKEMPLEDIQDYAAHHPVTRFAGGYGVQDRDDLIEIIDGSVDTVIGAPMEKVIEHLKSFSLAL